MTTPASPAPGGGAAQPSPTGSQAVRPPADPHNLVAQAQEKTSGAEQARQGLTPDEETRLGELLAKRDTAAGHTPLRLKVEGDHESMTFGGVTIGRDYTDVPPSMAGDITEAAALAGVKITQES
jgi:hypothetical protein